MKQQKLRIAVDVIDDTIVLMVGRSDDNKPTFAYELSVEFANNLIKSLQSAIDKVSN